MSKEKPKWVRNKMDDGDIPICPYCEKPYEDGAIFDVKNYPADGRAAMFFNCDVCNKEAQYIFDWDQMRISEDISGLLAKIKDIEKEVDERGKKIQDLVDRIANWPKVELKTKEKSKIIQDFLDKAEQKKNEENK